MGNKDRVQIIFVKPLGGVLARAFERFQSGGDYSTLECDAPQVLGLMAQGRLSLVLLHSADAHQLSGHLQLLRSMQEFVRERRVRVVLVSNSGDSSLEKKAELFGCSEILREPIPLKSLIFKIERQLKLLPVDESGALFHVSVEQFEQGSWELVESTELQALKGFVYVPEGVTQLSEETFEGFWSYFGAEAPQLSKQEPREWIFLDRKPQPLASLDALPSPVRKYLSQRFPGQVHGSLDQQQQPLMTPLAFAFLVSELMNRRDLSPEEIASKVCGYLATSLQGARVELQVCRAERCFTYARSEKEAELPSSSYHPYQEMTRIPIMSPDGTLRVGYLVLYSAQNESDFSHLTPDYLTSLTLSLSGLTLSFLESYS